MDYSLSKKPLIEKQAVSKDKDEAARLLSEADSFLRLGLIDQAVAHLADALRRTPSLRVLREPLVKLYVTQGRYEKAIAELWALLGADANPHEEIRFLRYIIRLGDPDHTAEPRLKEIVNQRQLEAPAPTEERAETRLSVTAIGQELREYLGNHRPPTDLKATVVFSDAESQRYMESAQPSPSAATRPSSAEAEAAAEAMALSSGGLRAELKAVERSLSHKRPAEALRRLQILSLRFPHSKTVQNKLRQLEQVLAAQSSDPLLNRKTLEVSPDDIQEEHAAPPRQAPPPPPRPRKSSNQIEPVSDTARAFRTGVTMRSFGQHQQAIEMFNRARSDAMLCARAALMAGLCYRDLHRIPEAIASFMHGINTPEVSESHLSELFYELARSHELLSKAGEAILFYRLSLGAAGSFRDCAERIAKLQK